MKMLLVGLLLGGTIGTLVAKPVNARCLVSGEAVDPEVTSKVTVVIGFCCNNCAGDSKKLEHRVVMGEAIAAAASKAVNSKCPVTGKAVDGKRTHEHEGKTIAFCSVECRSAFKKSPEELAGKVKTDAPGNKACPLTGRSVAADAVHAIDLEYGFCRGRCQRRFERDPGKVLENAAKEAAKRKRD